MIALVFSLVAFGLLGVLAYGALIVVGGMIIAPLIWTWKLARFIVRLAGVLAHAAFFIAWDAVRFVARLAWRAVRFTIHAAVQVGGDLAGLAVRIGWS